MNGKEMFCAFGWLYNQGYFQAYTPEFPGWSISHINDSSLTWQQAKDKIRRRLEELYP